MKRKILQSILIIVLAVSLVCLVACKPPTAEGEKDITITLIDINNEENVLELNTDAEYLGQALDELVEQEKLTMETSTGSLGRFINNIGSLNPQGSQWIGIYADEDDSTLIYSEFTYEYNNKTYYSIQMGIDDMPIKDELTYIFVLNE